MLNFKNSVPFLLVICFLVCGCSPENLSDLELPIPTDDTDIDTLAENPSRLEVSDTIGSVSPASTPFQVPDVNTSPEDVCRQFLTLLNLGESNQFELLLSPTALSVCSQLQFSLPPLGEPNSKVTIQPAAFGTLRQKLCFVDCEIVDSESTQVALMLRNGRQGWRVAGMLVDGNESESKNLLSFENLTDVEQIRDSLQASVD